MSCFLCRTGSYCSADCMESNLQHHQYCAAICMLEQLEWEKKKKALVCGVDAEKLPLKLKKKLVKLVGERPILNFLLNNKKSLDCGTQELWLAC